MSTLNRKLCLQIPLTQPQSLPLQITWSGRIDNRRELENLLSLSPDDPDEVLVHAAFLRFHTRCAYYILGDFAFVIWDPKLRTLYAARDIFGCKPLYYYHDASQIACADTLPDLLALPGIPQKANVLEILSVFTEVLASSKLYTDATYYQDIYRLTPGHYLWITPAGLEKKAYWTLDWNRSDLAIKNESECLEAFQELLFRAVRRRLSDKTASELSGGLDCSLILSTTQTLQHSVHALGHVDRREGSSSEHVRMELIATALKLSDVGYVDDTHFEFLPALELCRRSFAGGMPFIFFCFAQNIYQIVAQQKKSVLLSGFGGDECVTGHATPFIFTYLQRHEYRTLWQELTKAQHFKGAAVSQRKLLKNILSAQLRLWRHGKSLHRSLTLTDQDLYLRPEYYERYHLPHRYENHLVNPFFEQIHHREYQNLVGPDSFHVRMRVEYSAILAQALGFEYRYPLLDRELIEFCYALPLHFKRQQGRGRYLARRYLQRYVPSDIYDNPSKLGGIVPATLEQYLRDFAAGKYTDLFQDQPWIDLQKPAHPEHAQLKPFSALMGYLFRAMARRNV